jgi:hypothetical protein
MEWVIENLGNLVPIVTGVIALAAAISVITPSKADDRILQLVLDVVNKLGLNVGKARNADDS